MDQPGPAESLARRGGKQRRLSAWQPCCPASLISGVSPAGHKPREQCLEAATTVAWEGRFGDADLKIEIPPSGRIHAEWRTPAGSRQKVVDSIEQLERSVLFQLMVGANVRDEVREEIADAVALTLANRTPLPSEDPSQPRRPPRRKARPNQPPRRRTGGGAASRGRRRH